MKITFKDKDDGYEFTIGEKQIETIKIGKLKEYLNEIINKEQNRRLLEELMFHILSDKFVYKEGDDLSDSTMEMEI